MERGGCVYIMTNKRQSVLYTGITSDIVARTRDHKNRVHPGSFTDRYNCDRLVYHCFYPHIEEAITAEKAIKGGNRKSKEALINSMNPQWKDLYDELLVQ
ncbi:GIY-YIG nuclease family protein [Mucilaginibacter polytrichastri]|uniref:GIY-YIG nuclease family protein n=1 Tax=Mucilaginibacter polytrichastri TaxID=1302689 RepID=UPI0008ED205F|nr:GIY-YIG nuclease family protein [Mucilaginibacter polytrichastri]SFS45935.1 putative endonuclease [Mucilaginibacter polytrichastri]